MVSATTRAVGLLAILVGIIASLTGFGVFIGLPLIIIGFIMFIPEALYVIIIGAIILIILAAVVGVFVFAI